MEKTSIEQAAITALQVFLQEQFDNDTSFKELDGVDRVWVRDEWPPAGDNLKAICISILAAGTRQDSHLTEEVVKQKNLPNNQGEFTWSIKAITQPLQLDIWALYDAHRKMVVDALDRYLNMGPLFTLGAGAITRDGPLLRMDPTSGHEGTADFTFDGPRPIDGEASAAEYQFRSLVSGQVDCELTFTATTARLARLKLAMSLGSAVQSDANFTLQKVGDDVRITSATL